MPKLQDGLGTEHSDVSVAVIMLVKTFTINDPLS